MLSTSVHSVEIQSLYTFASIYEIILALVYNSIDSFATKIQVKIDTDNWAILVKDNGSGFISLDHIGEVPILSSGRTYGRNGLGKNRVIKLSLVFTIKDSFKA
jgi:hypothetical protein